jgi:hypothetical protein
MSQRISRMIGLYIFTWALPFIDEVLFVKLYGRSSSISIMISTFLFVPFLSLILLSYIDKHFCGVAFIGAWAGGIVASNVMTFGLIRDLSGSKPDALVSIAFLLIALYTLAWIIATYAVLQRMTKIKTMHLSTLVLMSIVSGAIIPLLLKLYPIIGNNSAILILVIPYSGLLFEGLRKNDNCK